MPIEKIFVDLPLIGAKQVKKLSDAIGIAPQPVEGPSAIYDIVKTSDDPWKKGKKIIWVTTNKGQFFKKCPGTRSYLCCGYQIFHLASYCTMDCSYCILQSYFHPPILQLFINEDDLYAELDAAFSQHKTLRIGTGEFSDSLIWEKWSDTTPELVSRFASQEYAVLELKTKTVAIDGLEHLSHRKKTIMAWSLNTPRMIASQERGTASLQARLRAARQCGQWGYPLAFHFDPMFIYPGCEKEYQDVFEQLFESVDKDAVVWISMGTFRSMPELHPIVKQRFPESDIIYGEFINGLDGKLRYFKPLRIKLYQCIVRWMRENAPNVLLYLCMEDEQVWMNSFGFSPESKGGLPEMLDNAARRHCGVR